MQAGMDHFIVKPFFFTDISHSMEMLRNTREFFKETPAAKFEIIAKKDEIQIPKETKPEIPILPKVEVAAINLPVENETEKPKAETVVQNQAFPTLKTVLLYILMQFLTIAIVFLLKKLW